MDSIQEAALPSRALCPLSPACAFPQIFRLDKHKSIADAVTAITEALGMDAVEGSGTVSGAARQHRLLLSGILHGDQAALVRADLRFVW
jgi:hypothetical protein